MLLAVLLKSALVPQAVFSVPDVLFLKASCPIAILSDTVLRSKALVPIAIFLSPFTFSSNACVPTATLSSASVVASPAL